MPFYNTILFDADGTLLDFKAAEKNALEATLLSVGITATDELTLTYSAINEGMWKMLERGEIKKSELKVRRFEEFAKKCGICADGEALAKKYESLLSEQGILLDGAFELMSHLYGIADMYIVTNGILSVQKGRMSRVSIKHFIKKSYISDEIGYEKPAREFFDYVMADIDGFDKEHTLVVGDSLSSDIKGAINAGLDCVWYNPKGATAPEGMDITYTVSDLAEIENIVIYGRERKDPAIDGLITELSYEGICVKADCPAASFTTFKLGGCADAAIFPKNADELSLVLDKLCDKKIRFTVLGNGSNCVFHDGGYRGAVVVLTEMKNIRRDGCYVEADCGVTLSALSLYANSYSLTGLEFAYGIPGSVGGGVVMNAGAYGGCIANTAYSALVYDVNAKSFRTLSKEELCHSYRHSVFTNDKSLVLVSACFKLSDGDREKGYEFMKTIRDKRRSSQPLEKPSAGSVFKKPADDIHVSRMIDEMGLKGTRVGGVCVSPKHAGFIVNDLGGTTNDLKDVITKVRREFYEKHGFMLECEIVFVS